MDIAMLGIDLGKNVCSLAGLDAVGRVVLRRRMKREMVAGFARQWCSCVAAMEACCGAHHLGRQLASQGHEVRLMSPEYVRPYVKAQKNDDRDAEAIAEAATRPTMRFVPLKSEEQLDMQSLHRVRERLVAERTALINQLRAVLLERGITALKGRRKLERALAGILADDTSDLRLAFGSWSAICAGRGRPSTTGSRPSIPSLRPGRALTKPPAGWRRCQGSGASTRRRWWQLWVMGAPLRAGATWRLGSGWYRGR